MTPERFARLRATLDQRQPDLTVITDYVHKGRNLSAIVRTADAVGIGEIHCVIGDADYRSFRGTALGSQRWVDVHRYRQLQQPCQRLKAEGFQIVAAHLSPQAVNFRTIDFCKPTALLMGSEREGISEHGEQWADHHITIPMVGMAESFNVSVAAGIILNEALDQRQRAGLYDQQRLDQTSYERLFFEWAHPKIRDFCRRHQLDYPPLQEDGEIENQSAWYADMRAQIALKQPSRDLLES